MARNSIIDAPRAAAIVLGLASASIGIAAGSMPLRLAAAGAALLSAAAVAISAARDRGARLALAEFLSAQGSAPDAPFQAPPESRLSGYAGPALEAERMVGRIRHNSVAASNLWRKQYELSQDILSTSHAVHEGVKAVSRSSDALERTASVLDEGIDNSRRTVDGMRETIESTSRAAESQAAAVEQSSAAVEELLASIRSVASISEGKRAMLAALVSTVEKSKAAIGGAMAAFESIGASTASILDIASVIGEIAERTNLLSMNAAIEAAHAGDRGKGFAVVASEIKKLAEGSRKNAAEISRRLGEIRGAVQRTAATSDALRGSMDTMMDSVKGTTESMEEILGGLAEMSAGTTQISTALSSLVESAEATKRNTAENLGNADRLRKLLDGIGSGSDSNVQEAASIAKSVRAISDSLGLLFDVSDDNGKNLARLRERIAPVPTRKRFVCDYLPPYQFVAEGEISGVFTDVVRLMLAELGEEADIEFMPWRDALELATKRPGVFLMTALRTAQREGQYRWIGPVIPDDHFVFRLAERDDISVETARDLARYTVGSVENNFSYKYFLDSGVPESKIKLAKIHAMNIQNLLLGEVDLIPMGRLQLHYQLKAMKRSADLVAPAFRIDSFPTDAYMAVSLSTPDDEFERYRAAFEKVKAGPEYARLLKEYR